MNNDLLNMLLPVLGRRLDHRFNVFDVMHHGTHEKQLSNVFGWLLDAGGSHNLGDTFVRIFVDVINNADQAPEPQFPVTGYTVRQEVNVASSLEAADIADIVLENDKFRIVVENYFTSDGHGHGFGLYDSYSRAQGRTGAVVMLCRDEDVSRLTDGWQHSHVLTYSALISSINASVQRDTAYRTDNPESASFIEQMYRKFAAEGGPVEDRDVLEFLQAMTAAGEGGRYRTVPHESAAEQFASDLTVQARQRYLEGRDLLIRIKRHLTSYASGPLRTQLTSTFGEGVVTNIHTKYKGNYQWTVAIYLDKHRTAPGTDYVQLKFGPSAWFANEKDPYWKHAVDPAVADYSRVFITRADIQSVTQTDVKMSDLVEGLDSTDLRLHNAIVRVLDRDDG